MTQPTVFLDRDGVLNRAVVRDGKPYPPASVDELAILPEAPEALGRLARAGYRLVVVTNQPDVASGRQRREVVDAMHAVLAAALPIDEIRVCYHDDRDGCACRKPAPGLLLQPPAADLARSAIIGDRWRDIAAGRRAGVGAAVWIDRGYTEQAPEDASIRATSLTEAVDWILTRHLRVKIFADGAALDEMATWAARPDIRGFTTNPTLMRKAGIGDYAGFARAALALIGDRPISFEVFSDDFGEMESQAREIASWGPNVYVKIPITNTAGEPATSLMHRLAQSGVHVNVTAVLTLDQVDAAVTALAGGAASVISIFAGRIADTGRDPVPIVAEAVTRARRAPLTELIWASPREALNVYQANAVGCHIITATTDLLAKLPLAGKDLSVFSLETVKMFRDDAVRAGFTLKGNAQFA